MRRFVYFNSFSFFAWFLITACTVPEQPKSDLELCPDAKIGSYALATQLDGEITTSDCTYDDPTIVPTKYVDYYKFSVDKETRVTFLVRTDGVQLALSVFDDKQQRIIFQPDRGFVKLSQQLVPGNYTLAVQFTDGNQGEYTLTTSTLEQGFSGCPLLTRMELGVKVKGEFTSSGCDDGYVDYYEFSLPEQDSVAICGSVAIALSLRDGTSLEDNPILRGGCLLRDLQAGDYVVSKYNRGLESPFTYLLSVTTIRKGFLYCYDVKPLEFGVTRYRKLDTTDCEWPPYHFECGTFCYGGFGKADYYGFELTDPKEIAISYDFSGDHPYTRLFDRRTFSGLTFQVDPQGKYILQPGKYVLIVGYRYTELNAPDELEPYSLAINFN